MGVEEVRSQNGGGVRVQESGDFFQGSSKTFGIAGLPAPFRGGRVLAEERRCALDRLRQHECDDLDTLLCGGGLEVAAI